jgi:hypothetical protein
MLTVVAALLISTTAWTKTVEEGHWINLFDGETTFGWTELGDVTWGAENGELKTVSGTGGLLATTSQFKDFELEAKIKIKPGSSTGIVFRAGLEGHPTANGSSIAWIREQDKGEWRNIKIKAVGDEVSIDVEGKGVRKVVGSREVGYIGVLYHHNGGAEIALKDIKLRPLQLTSLFNGKNLKGWDIIPGRASKFEVIDGAISIKDGNGQIETQDVFQDFVLQMDIISNGKELNSGVFFRGPVGKFWLGYESQVRNHWRGDDRTKPVDYGTGGNYGNQSTRKVVSTDHEWFQKTVVANGNHFSVWINGYQTSDFLDTRPVNRGFNAKQGFVADAGTIHLQGHDPTTDLSFKNINVQSYDK